MHSTRWRKGQNELSLRVDDRGATLILYLGGEIGVLTNYPMGQEDKAKRDAEAIVSLGDLKFVCNGAEQHYAAAS